MNAFVAIVRPRLDPHVGRLGPLVEAPLTVLDRRRRLAAGLSLLAAAILLGAFAYHLAILPDLSARIGIDLRQYTDAANRWLSGASFYQPWQLDGRYVLPRDEFDVARLPVLYPPYAIVLFLPFTLTAITAPFWWALPLLVTALVVRHWRPRPWTWPFLTLCALSGDTMWLTISGNPAMWVMMSVALGTLYGWPSIGVLLKPSLAPFALVRGGGRSWWLAGIALAIASLGFGPLWFDYLTALSNVDGSGIFYSTNNIPMLLIPMLAWLGRSTPASTIPSDRESRGASEKHWKQMSDDDR